MTYWAMIQECLECIDEMNDSQAKFIQDLFDHCSESEAHFIEETTEEQRKWLYALHDYYCNGNLEAFDDYDDYDDAE